MHIEWDGGGDGGGLWRWVLDTSSAVLQSIQLWTSMRLALAFGTTVLRRRQIPGHSRVKSEHAMKEESNPKT